MNGITCECEPKLFFWARGRSGPFSDCESLRTQKTILEQKKLRLNNSVQGHEKEIRSLEVALKNLDFEMNKLNDLYYKNTA